MKKTERQLGKKMILRALILGMLLYLPLFCHVQAKAQEVTVKAANPYQDLHLPTQIIQIGRSFYITDCYHDQVISAKSFVPLRDWNIVGNRLSGPHSIAGDGEILVVTDTENNAVRVYVQDGERSSEVQTIPNVGVRPHYVIYNQEQSLFWVWSSMTGEMYRFQKIPGTTQLVLHDVLSVPELSGMYARSFTIDGNLVYFPCVTLSSIIAVDKTSFKICEIIPVPQNIAGIVQIQPTPYGYLLTVTTDIHAENPAATVIWTDRLENLTEGVYTDESDLFGRGNRPYYINEVNGTYYTAVTKPDGAGIYCFKMSPQGIVGVKEVLR